MIACIAAYDKNHVIGCGGKIPWSLPGEQARFRELTTGNIVVMGRNTYCEIGHPLPNRHTILVSSTMTVSEPNCETVSTLAEALERAAGQDVFISGGEQLYREALPFADVLYLTEVEGTFSGDRFFPEFSLEDFVLEAEERVEGEIPYTYRTYRRKPFSFVQIQEQLAHIQKNSGIVLGLSTMQALLSRLGNPQNQVPIIHIAGTNGKGSTGAMLSSVLQKEGYRVGHYASPAVFHPMEVWKINGTMISEADYTRRMCQLLRHRQAMEQAGQPLPTVFELETALAFLTFQEEQCDIAVIECGMGGREDATNVIDHPLVSLLTSIGLDHVGFLGDTIERITEEKCGIIKEGVPVVLQHQSEPVETIVRRVCSERNCALTITAEEQPKLLPTETGSILYYNDTTWELSLSGSYQGKNAAQVIETVAVLRSLGVPISDESLRRGLAGTIWQGRFETVQTHPRVILDGAHNPNATEQLVASLSALRDAGWTGNLYLILGVLADKDYTRSAAMLAPLSTQIYTITPSNSRALSAEALADCVRPFCKEVQPMTIETAIDTALATAKEQDMILVCGSLSYLGEARRQIFKKRGSSE